MPSRVYMICDRYESGYGHGVKGDGLDLSKTPHDDPELGEAYQLGYEEGFERNNLYFAELIQRQLTAIELLRNMTALTKLKYGNLDPNVWNEIIKAETFLKEIDGAK